MPKWSKEYLREREIKALQTSFRKQLTETLKCQTNGQAMAFIHEVDKALGIGGGSDVEFIAECSPVDLIHMMMRAYIEQGFRDLDGHIRDDIRDAIAESEETPMNLQTALVQMLPVIWLVSRIPGCGRDELWNAVEDGLEWLLTHSEDLPIGMELKAEKYAMTLSELDAQAEAVIDLEQDPA